MVRFLTRTVGLFAIAALLLAPMALAQTGQQQMPPQQEDIEVSDAELDAVAEIFLELEEVRDEFQPRFADAESPEEAQQIQQEFEQQATAVIEDNEEMELERYEQVILALRQDPELEQEVVARMEAMRSEDPDTN